MPNLSMIHKALFAAIPGVLLCILLLPPSACYSRSKENSKERSRFIQYSFTLQNKSPRLLEKAQFWAYAPVKQTSVQRCVGLKVSYPYELIKDELGNQILHFTFSNLPPYSSKIITIRAELVLHEPQKTSPEVAGKTFLQAEKYVQSDDPQIKKLARQLHQLSPQKTAEKIFLWVTNHIQYTGFAGGERGALYALKHKKGDCTELMDLFLALSRVGNIPARGIAGYVLPESGIVKPVDFHNWAEFYDDGVWRLADPQKKIFLTNHSDYIAMRIIGSTTGNPMGENNRFRLAGKGLSAQMNF